MKANFKKILAILITLSMLATFCAVPMTAGALNSNDLKFGSDGKFKILAFADVQESDKDPNGIARLQNMMSKAIDRENPDIVVFVGDQTEINIKDVQGDFKSLLEQILAPVVEANVPYAFVFGNHDFQSAYSGQRTDKDAMLAVYQSIGDCRTTDPEPSLYGTGTCKIPVYSSDGSSVAVDLFMVDSNTYQNPITGEGGYDNPHADQLEWIADNKDAGAKSIMFQHIPMPEIYNLVKEDASGSKTYGGKTYIQELKDGVSGALGEFPCPCNYENNTGEFAAYKQMGDVLGVVTGHDHLNDFSGTYDGITMTAVPGMTYYNYGNENVRGYGVIELDENDLSSYDYHSVKFNELDTEAIPYALNVDFSGGLSIDNSGLTTPIANSGSGVTYKFDQTLNKTVASFDGSSGFGYTLSEAAKEKMKDGYTYEILYKLPSVPAADLAAGMYSGGFGAEYEAANNRINYWQSFEGDTRDYRQLWYGNNSVKTNEWIHLVATWNKETGSNGQLLAFLNGTKVDESNPDSSILKFDANGEFYIGGNAASNGSFRDGTACDIAFVKIYDKVYAPSEIPALYEEATTPGEGFVDGKYYQYDEIEYSDLYKNKFPLSPEGFEFGGGNALTYDATSPSYSVKLKFRWTAGSANGIQFSFDRSGTGNSISYPFGVWVKNPNDNGAGANGAWHLKPTDSKLLVDMDIPATQGKQYDIEFGRLKVAESAAEHGGEYYVYLKVDGKLIQETYTSFDGSGNYTSAGTPCRISNEIMLDDWSSKGNKASAIPAPDSYEDYAEVSYFDLLDNGARVADEIQLGSKTFTYANPTDTYSAILKFRWKPVTGVNSQLCFDTLNANSGFDYMFGVQTYGATSDYPNGYIWLRPGMGPKAALPKTLQSGQYYDIEFGRLKVKSGANAGKYYLYYKMDGVLLAEDYVDEVEANGTYITDGDGGHGVTCNLSNKFYITNWGGGGGHKMTYIPTPDVYDTYDEIYYSNLYIGGNPVPSNGMNIGGSKFTYNKTSNSASAILKFRWKSVDPNSNFQLCFDPATKSDGSSACEYTFGLQYYQINANEGRPNGAFWLRVGNENLTKLDAPLVSGNDYDVEFARLKVVSGDNVGKYKFYLKVSDTDKNVVFYQEKYIDASIIDVNGSYTTATDGAGTTTCTLSNVIYFTHWSGSGVKICEPEYEEEYYDYDDLEYADLRINGEALPSVLDIGGAKRPTYNATSSTYSAVLKYNFTPGSTLQLQSSFDTNDGTLSGDPSFPFSAFAKYGGQSGLGNYTPGANGGWELNPAANDCHVDMTEPLIAGNNYDIEMGRLKVKTGANKNKYYVYLKVDGELLLSKYVSVNDDGTYSSTRLSNIFYFYAPGGSIHAVTVPETYDDYDEVYYENLRINGNALPSEGIDLGSDRNCTYNATSASYSAVLKFRWTAGADARFVTYFDAWASTAYPFCLAVKSPNFGGLGATAGATGAWHLDPTKNSQIVQMAEPITEGSTHDMEFGRLLVKTGENKGKYYVYLKVDGEIVNSYYYAGVDANGNYNDGGALNNTIYFNSSSSGNLISPIPIPETYEDYDEIGYDDLMDESGNPLTSGGTALSGGTLVKYNKTSPTGSVIFKYRWTIGDVVKFQMSFDGKIKDGNGDDAIEYMFGAWLDKPDSTYTNGKMWLRPGYGPQVNLPEALTPGTAHNVEFARLKVKSGANKGKYLVYIKIDDVLVAEEYVSVNITNNQYVSNPASRTVTLNNEFFFAFWGSNGNAISNYKAAVNGHDGTRGDLDDNGILNANDLTALIGVLIGATDISGMPDGIADFNNDGDTDILDLVALKKYLAKGNTYTKSGSLNLGMQDHLLEYDNPLMTAEYLADATATMGANTYRLSYGINALFAPTSTNSVTVDTKNMAELKSMVAALKAKGIDNILLISPYFVLPYNYNKDYTKNGMAHHGTVPDLETDKENYIAWLEVNAAAYKKLAQEIPEIKFFEPFNEINLTTARIEKLGCGWSASQEVQNSHKFTVTEKAGIMADLCWHISKAVKEVDPANQITTPSISISPGNTIVQDAFTNELYKAIESGAYPTDSAVADKIVDHYFTIVNIHSYPSFTNKGENTENNNVTAFANGINNVYNTVKAHGDGDSRVWLTETGMSTMHPDGANREMTNAARILRKALEKINTNLTFIDTVILYKIADMSADYNAGVNACEQAYGLFYACDDMDNAYVAKETAKVVYSFFHNGTTDYSALNALADRY